MAQLMCDERHLAFSLRGYIANLTNGGPDLVDLRQPHPSLLAKNRHRLN